MLVVAPVRSVVGMAVAENSAESKFSFAIRTNNSHVTWLALLRLP